jgi:diazepam-binding inhibitor (GABA receptor modulator, acyl-CoA-binding protein)
MSDLDEQFAKAQLDVKTLTTRPSNDDLLELYATFKQATAGEAANAKKPGRFDFVGKANHRGCFQRAPIAIARASGMTPAPP